MTASQRKSDPITVLLRFVFGALIGVIFGLYLAFGAAGWWYVAIVAAGVVACSYVGYRYGDRFFLWVLKFWNRPGN